MKKFVDKILRANSGVSSKRLMGLSAGFSVIIIAFVDQFTDYQITDYVFSGLVYLAIAGIVGVAAENFALKGSMKDATIDVTAENKEEPK